MVEQQPDSGQHGLVALPAHLAQDVSRRRRDGLRTAGRDEVGFEHDFIPEHGTGWHNRASHLHIRRFEQQVAEWRVTGRGQHRVLDVGQLQAQRAQVVRLGFAAVAFGLQEVPVGGCQSTDSVLKEQHDPLCRHASHDKHNLHNGRLF